MGLTLVGGGNGVDGSNCSTETQSPGAITCWSFLQFLVDLVLQGHIFIALYIHLSHLGSFMVSGHIGRMTSAKSRSSFLNQQCPRW